ncbi:TorF family putative porin [Plastorhodobacter daqingensis]|uniref:TorF family putative porin n=1 Tax=Plastorhodobacter daqingensis TaxID=1387281 RepID=A0ABW2UMF1_9RHOB
MKYLVPALATAAGLFAGAASAQEMIISGGATLTTNYISNGITQTQGNPAFQPWVEVESMGFYGGAWASNVKFPDSDDRTELDLYVGYRGETFGGFGYDFGYARYFYNRSGDAGGELLASLSAQMADGFSLGTDFAYDPQAEDLTASLLVGYQGFQGLGVSGEFGRSQPNSNNFWNVGVGYDITDYLGVDLRYHDTTSTAGIVALSGTVTFELFR